MPSHVARFAVRRGWRAVALAALLPVLSVSFGVGVAAHGVVRYAACGVYVTAAAAFLVIAWRHSRGGCDA